MRNRTGLLVSVAVLALGLNIGGLATTAEGRTLGSAGAESAPILGEPCQQPEKRDDSRWNAVDFSKIATVANGFDRALSAYTSYGGTYWHRDGGLRVRIASGRPDSAVAEEVARADIANTSADIVGGIQVEATDVSLADLYSWASDARDGLTFLSEDDIVSVDIDELCQYVQVFASSPFLASAARLSASEQSKYFISGAPMRAEHSRSSDTSPYNGGVRLWPNANRSDYAWCTGGYTMVRSGTRFMTTAGHCGVEPGVDAWYTTGYGNYVGSQWFNPYEDGTCHCDVQLLAYMSYVSPIWWGGPHTTDRRYVTAKLSYPVLGQPVWISAGNSGNVAGEVSRRWTTCADAEGDSLANRVNFWYGDETQPGDSGSPVAMGNGATSRTDDVTALGIHICAVGNQEWYTRVDTMEAATDATIVFSAL